MFSTTSFGFTAKTWSQTPDPFGQRQFEGLLQVVNLSVFICFTIIVYKALSLPKSSHDAMNVVELLQFGGKKQI